MTGMSKLYDDPDVREEAMRRLEMLDGVLLALRDQERLMAAVYGAADADAATQAVAEEFDVPPDVAVAMMDLQVRRFTGADRRRVIEGRDRLRAELGIS